MYTDFVQRISVLFLILAASILGATLFFAKPDIGRIEDRFPLETFNRDVEVILAGDVMLGRSVMAKILELNDLVYPFRLVAEKLKAADIVFVNLENPIIKDCKPHLGGFTF